MTSLRQPALSRLLSFSLARLVACIRVAKYQPASRCSLKTRSMSSLDAPSSFVVETPKLVRPGLIA